MEFGISELWEFRNHGIQEYGNLGNDHIYETPIRTSKTELAPGGISKVELALDQPPPNGIRGTLSLYFYLLPSGTDFCASQGPSRSRMQTLESECFLYTLTDHIHGSPIIRISKFELAPGELSKVKLALAKTRPWDLCVSLSLYFNYRIVFVISQGPYRTRMQIVPIVVQNSTYMAPILASKSEVGPGVLSKVKLALDPPMGFVLLILYFCSIFSLVELISAHLRAHPGLEFRL